MDISGGGWRSRIVGHGEASPGELTANPRNWRKHPKAQRDALAAVLDRVGWVQDVIVNRTTGHLVDGHARLDIARQRGEASIPVVYVELDEAEEALVLATLDPLAAMAEADTDALADLLASVTSEDAALTSMLDALAKAEGIDTAVEGLTDPDDVPEPVEAPYVQRGEVYRLGAHRLMCGDSTSAEDVARLLDGALADAIWTDPPYGVAVATRIGTTGISNSQARVETAKMRARAGYDERLGEIENDDLDLDALTVFLGTTLGLAKQHTRAGAAWYVCAPHGPMGLAFASTLTTLEVWKASVVWVKDSLVMGRADYHYRHEPIYYGWTPGAAHHAVTDRTQDTVWEIPRPKKSADHPTMKPVALVERAIVNSTDHGERVYDPFVGSGTTLIGCEALGRVGYGMEVSPRYVQVCIDRWEAFTGLKAERV